MNFFLDFGVRFFMRMTAWQPKSIVRLYKPQPNNSPHINVTDGLMKRIIFVELTADLFSNKSCMRETNSKT